ncbi:MAG: hypothetical protein MRK01_13905 [Candidatus Scalindua sp.]|nr:hypothetical protein [Candidatus Scalindua sp.]
MLKDEGKIDDDTINKLMSLRHSGFSVHNGVKVAREDENGKEAISQYIIRNTFFLPEQSISEHNFQKIFDFC